MANPTSLSAATFSSHNGNFKPKVRILSSRIKGQNFAPLKTKHHSFTPYK